MFSRLALSCLLVFLGLNLSNAASLKRQENNFNVVFIGDSLTSEWETDGRRVWANTYADLGSFNFGVSGLLTTQLIDEIQSGAFDSVVSKVVVLLIGGNDLHFGGLLGTQVAENILTIIQLLQQKIPNVTILLLGLLPAGVPAPIMEQGKIVNSIISTYENGQSVRYLDMQESFATSDGEPFRELYHYDLVHLVEAGYQAWANTMAPLLNELLESKMKSREEPFKRLV